MKTLFLLLIFSVSAQASTIKFISRVAARDTDQGEADIISVRTKSYGDSYVDVRASNGETIEIKKEICARSGLNLGDILAIARQKSGKIIVTRDQAKRVIEVNLEENF